MDDPSVEIGAAYENLKDAALTPLHMLTSRPAKRTYLTTLLLALTSLALLLVAILAYITFYYLTIPSLGFSRPIPLQFSPSSLTPTTYGTVALAPDVSPSQPYDVSIRLRLPRTPANIAVGNFMLDVHLLLPDGRVLARSSRMASLTYRSAPAELLGKIARLPAYALGWRAEADTLDVRVFEEAQFAKGWPSKPETLRVEVSGGKGDGRVQVYGAEVRFRSRFNGVRWLMYNQRTLSFVVFTSTFWTVEMVFAFSAYLVLTLTFGATHKSTGGSIGDTPEQDIKAEDSDGALSDTSRTFPTLSSQPPLHYTSPKAGNEEREREEEEEEREREQEKLAALPADAADDEDEDDDFVFDHGVGGLRSDSGLGTSMESGAGSAADALRRRRKMKR